MKQQTAKDYLNQIRKLDIFIGHRIEELNQMRAKVTLVAGIDYAKDRVQTSPSSGNQQIEAIVDMERDILELIHKETAKKHEIIGQIQQLDNPLYVDILFRRYVDCHSFERIACDMGYVYNYVCNLHGEALREFQNKVLN